MNASRNAQQQAGQFNQLLAQQAMQQQGMFQNTLPLYQRGLDFYSRRAGFGMHQPDNSFLQQQPQQFQQPEPFSPFELGGAKYHGLSDRLKKGKGDGNAEMYGQGDINGRVRGMRPNTGAMPPAGIGAPPVIPPPVSPVENNRLIAAGGGSRRTMGQPMPTQPSMNRTGGVSDQQMGIWNNPEDRLRMAAAQDDIDRYQQLQSKQLLHNLAQRGLAESSVYGGGLQGLAENALQNFANFRRQQAIGAGQEEERRVQNLMNALAPGMGFGSQAAGAFGQLGAQQQQQAAQSQQALQNLFQVFGQLFAGQPGQIPGGGSTPNRLGQQMRW